MPPVEVLAGGGLTSLLVLAVGWATAGLWRESGKLRESLRLEIDFKNKEIEELKKEVRECGAAQRETERQLWVMQMSDASKQRELEYLKDKVRELERRLAT